jgi:gliding motility-associated lipoprotein GldH
MKNSKPLFNLILIFILTIFSISCDKGPVFEKYLKLTNSTWDRFDIKQFEIPVNEVAVSYDITLIVRCTDQFKMDKLPFYVILTSPKGEESIREISVPVRENGKLITEPKESKTESRLILWKSFSMADKGKYKITIENLIPKIQTEGIDEIGIVVTKAI